MTLSFEEIDSATITDEQLERYHTFQRVILAERLPGDPLPPFGTVVRPLQRPAPNVRTAGLAAVDGEGRWVGVAITVAADGDDKTLRVDLGVLPDHRRGGIGSDLLDRVAARATASGRQLVIGDTHDTVPAGAAFAESVGATPGTRNHVNRLVLADVDRTLVQRWVDEGPTRAPDYELVAFDSPTPDEYVDAVADIINVINDAPTDDLESPPVQLTGEMFQAFEGLGLSAGIQVW